MQNTAKKSKTTRRSLPWVAGLLLIAASALPTAAFAHTDVFFGLNLGGLFASPGYVYTPRTYYTPAPSYYYPAPRVIYTTPSFFSFGFYPRYHRHYRRQWHPRYRWHRGYHGHVRHYRRGHHWHH